VYVDAYLFFAFSLVAFSNTHDFRPLQYLDAVYNLARDYSSRGDLLPDGCIIVVFIYTSCIYSIFPIRAL